MSANALDPSTLLALPGSDWLNIGGTENKAGWKILNIQPGAHVDHVGDVRDLSQFSDQSFDVVYASHVIEHLGYQRDLVRGLGEVRRILRPGGKFFVSVPDLDTLCRLFVHEKASAQDRFQVMRMMFGGQMDDHDFHYVGLNAEMLANFLGRAGFSRSFRVPEFRLFDDTSAMQFGGVPISLNVIAIR
jgi:predicted SAM-dependent methyltransferase